MMSIPALEASGLGDGWRPIAERACQEIIALGGKIDQVKEKFGGLRIYYHNLDHEKGDTSVKAAERKCAITCEECGNLGTTVDLRGWLKTLCVNCAVDRLST